MCGIAEIFAYHYVATPVDREELCAIWGTGTPRREFLYGEDMSDACVYLMDVGWLNAMGLHASTTFEEGIDKAYWDYRTIIVAETIPTNTQINSRQP